MHLTKEIRPYQLRKALYRKEFIMKKIDIYFGKTNAYNAEIFVNVTDNKVIVLDTTSSLEELKEKYSSLSSINNFYDISEEIFDLDVLNDFELTKITSILEN